MICWGRGHAYIDLGAERYAEDANPPDVTGLSFEIGHHAVNGCDPVRLPLRIIADAGADECKRRQIVWGEPFVSRRKSRTSENARDQVSREFKGSHQ